MVQILEVGTDGDYVSQRVWMNNGITYEKWTVDGRPDSPLSMPAPTYNDTFASSLNHQTIEAFVEERRLAGRTTHVADIMGSAVFSNEPHLFDSLTGVRLRPLHPGAYPEGYPSPNWQEVTGNVYLPSTWEDVDRAMNATKFDLIVARPEGFLSRLSKKYCSREIFFENFLAIQFRVVSRLWERLTADEGVMLVQLTPEIAGHSKFKDWIKSLHKSGVEAEVFQDGQGLRGPCPILRLNKSQSSPQLLPHHSHTSEN